MKLHTFKIVIVLINLIWLNTLKSQTNYSCLNNNSSQKISSLLYYQGIHEQKDSVKLLISSILTSYPELNSHKIVVKNKNIKMMATARPKKNFIFKGKEKREYVIILDKPSGRNIDSLNYLMPCQAFKGLLAHEFAHLLDYSEKSNTGIIMFAFSYYFKKRKIERATDEICIKRGYGMELLMFNQYIFSSPFAQPAYLRKKQKYYLSISEIADTLNTL